MERLPVIRGEASATSMPRRDRNFAMQTTRRERTSAIYRHFEVLRACAETEADLSLRGRAGRKVVRSASRPRRRSVGNTTPVDSGFAAAGMRPRILMIHHHILARPEEQAAT